VKGACGHGRGCGDARAEPLSLAQVRAEIARLSKLAAAMQDEMQADALQARASRGFR